MKTIGEKPLGRGSGDALFISELWPITGKCHSVIPEGESFRSERHSLVKDAEAEKLFRIQKAEETKNSLMQMASERIALLQDAVDLDIATEEEARYWTAWKTYRVLLNRVDTAVAAKASARRPAIKR